MKRLRLLVVLGALGCGDSHNHLNGTISADANLEFDRVRAEWLVDELSVRYLQGEGAWPQEPVRLTLASSRADAGVSLSMVTEARVEHFVTHGDEYGRQVAEKPFPPVGHGVLRLRRVGHKPGELVEGDFQVTFAGSEDTLGGDFSAEVSALK